MKDELEALACRQISFDEFERRTAREWDKLARMIYERWRRRVPVGVSVEDVRQEMLLNAWRAVGEYDPARGVTLKAFVVWRACSKSLRFLHQQREALRRSETAESRHPLAYCQFRREDLEADAWFEGLAGARFADEEETGVEDLIDARADYEAALSQADGIDSFVLVALKLAGGDVRNASEMLFDEPRLRRWGRWNSPANAAKQIATTVAELFGPKLEDALAS